MVGFLVRALVTHGLLWAVLKLNRNPNPELARDLRDLAHHYLEP